MSNHPKYFLFRRNLPGSYKTMFQPGWSMILYAWYILAQQSCTSTCTMQLWWLDRLDTLQAYFGISAFFLCPFTKKPPSLQLAKEHWDNTTQNPTHFVRSCPGHLVRHSLTPHPTPHWAVQQHKTPVTRTPGAGAMASHHPPPIRCRSATIINTFTFYAMKGSLGVVEGPEGTVWDRRRSYPEGRCVWRVCWNRGLRNSQPVRFSWVFLPIPRGWIGTSPFSSIIAHTLGLRCSSWESIQTTPQAVIWFSLVI